MNWYRSSLGIKLLASVAIFTCAGCLVNPPSTATTSSTPSVEQSPEDLLSAERRSSGDCSTEGVEEVVAVEGGLTKQPAQVKIATEARSLIPSEDRYQFTRVPPMHSDLRASRLQNHKKSLYRPNLQNSVHRTTQSAVDDHDQDPYGLPLENRKAGTHSKAGYSE